MKRKYFYFTTPYEQVWLSAKENTIDPTNSIVSTFRECKEEIILATPEYRSLDDLYQLKYHSNKQISYDIVKGSLIDISKSDFKLIETQVKLIISNIKKLKNMCFLSFPIV